MKLALRLLKSNTYSLLLLAPIIPPLTTNYLEVASSPKTSTSAVHLPPAGTQSESSANLTGLAPALIHAMRVLALFSLIICLCPSAHVVICCIPDTLYTLICSQKLGLSRKLKHVMMTENNASTIPRGGVQHNRQIRTKERRGKKGVHIFVYAYLLSTNNFTRNREAPAKLRNKYTPQTATARQVPHGLSLAFSAAAAVTSPNECNH